MTTQVKTSGNMQDFTLFDLIDTFQGELGRGTVENGFMSMSFCGHTVLVPYALFLALGHLKHEASATTDENANHYRAEFVKEAANNPYMKVSCY